MHLNAKELSRCQLRALQDLGSRHLQFGPKYSVPEPACDAEAILEIRKVMLQMVLLEFSPVRWEAASR
jgi:hypothetical protein